MSQPVFVTAAPRDNDRLFIVEKSGQIKILDLDTRQVLATPFLDVSLQINTAGEGGLLGLAFDPNFAANRHVYVNLINTSGDTEIRRYTVSASDPNRADPSSSTLILSVDQPAGLSNHKAGWLGFGPDGYLYAALGDGGGGGDPGENGQNVNTLLGKMLRLDVSADAFPDDAARNYAIPSDNPFVGTAGADEIWALGLRNPWRNSFDRGLEQFFIADVGQGLWEEINLGSSGANYGWDVYEGPDGFEAGPLGPGTLTFPIHSYNHPGPQGGSITGGYVYRGESEGLHGQYFFADFVSGRISTLRFDGSSWIATDRTAQISADAGTINSPSSFGEDARGNLYVVDIGGEVFRLTPQWNSADLADTLEAGDGNDQIFAGAGGDALFGQNGDDTLWGMLGNDRLDGGAGSDDLDGGAGADELFGGDGADHLVGAAGADLLAGGSEADRFVFDGSALADARTGVLDRIGDFNQGNSAFANFTEGDLLDLSGLLASARASGQATASLVRVLSDANGGPARLQVDTDGVANGTDWITLATLDGVHHDQRVNVTLNGFSAETIHVQGLPTTTDFNPDSSDILWQRTDGALMNFHMEGPTIASFGFPGSIGPEWQTAGTADYNGDHMTDALFRRGDGSLLLHTIVNNQLQSQTIIGPVGNEWRVLGSSDFNADGRDDILWQRNDGTLMIFNMNGAQILAAPLIGQIGAEWKLQGTGDYNSDGTGDMLWRRGDGSLLMFEIANNQVQTASFVGQVGNEWQIVSSGDFNGDRNTDILWQRQDGALMIFDMDGARLRSAANVGQVGTEWDLEGTADYNSDGTADLLWHREGGALMLFEMADNQVAQATLIGQVGVEWEIL